MRPHPAWALAAGLALSVLCILAFRLRLSVPLQFLAGLALLGAYAAGAFRAFASNVWIEATYPLSAGLLSMLGGSVMSYSQASRQRREIRAAFSQYLSPAVVEQLSRHPEKLRLGGEQKIMTVYFSDLAGFTSFSEKLTPEELVHLLNRYLTLMTDTVLENEGTLDKYIGDAIVAFWNAPLPCPDHAAKALETVLLMKQGLAELNAGLQAEGLFPLRPRTGLNTGLMTVGNMGSSRRFDYTVMGSSVNLASRLEGVNKVYGTSVMVTRDTVEAAGGGFSFRELDTIRVMGQVTPVTIFELLGSPDEAAPRAGSLGPYAEALALYRRGEFRRAAEVFGATGGDPPSAAMASRCAALASDPPQEWDGVFDMTSK
jgi:adenylate cyclase